MPEHGDLAIAVAPPPSANAAAWLRPVIGALSPAGARGRLTILIFHRVHEQADPLFPLEMHAAVFRERLAWLRAWFNVLPLDEATAALARGQLPARSLALTFDDGYADNVTVALPILRDMGAHATFFIATGFVDGGRMWNDTIIEAVRAATRSPLDLSGLDLGRYTVDTPTARRAAIETLLANLKYRPSAERLALADAVATIAGNPLPTNLMMTGAELRALAASGMGVGAHTVSHPILARVDDAIARREIGEGREALEALVRQSVKLFAYPNGTPNIDYRAAHVRMTKALGFTAAVSTSAGAACAGSELHELPRFTPWDRTPLRYGARLARNLLTRGQCASE